MPSNISEQEEFEFQHQLEQEQTQLQPTPSSNPISRGWNSLSVPEQLSRQGLNQIANAIPEAPAIPTQAFSPPMSLIANAIGDLNTPGLTGNLPADFIKGTPKIAAETLAKVAPNFVSRGAIIGGVIGKGLEALPSSATNFIGEQAARLGKTFSGNKIEDIKNLFEHPEALLGAKSIEKAKEIYGAAVKGAGEFPVANEETAFDSAVQIAKDALTKEAQGELTPLQALEGRQNLDNVIRATKGTEGKININTSRLTKLYELRRRLDAVVKSDEGLDQADQIYSQAKLASKFRQLMPINQGGTPSQLKNILSMGALAIAKGNPLAALVPVAMAPATVGSITAGLGFANKIGPAISSAFPEIGQLTGAGLGLLKKKGSE